MNETSEPVRTGSILNEKTEEKRHFIIKSNRFIVPAQIHKVLERILEKDTYKVKRIRKAALYYTRLTISANTPELTWQQAKCSLLKSLGIKLRETTIRRKEDLEQKLPSKLEALEIVSININGTKEKVAELQEFIRIKKPAVVCLQETKRNERTRTLMIEGYTITEAKAGEQGYGLITAVRNSSGIIIKKSEACFNLLKTRLICPSGEIQIVNIYVNHDRDKKKTVLRAFQDTMRRSTEKGILCIGIGDWNTTPEKIWNTFSKKGIAAYFEKGFIGGTRFHKNGNTTRRTIDFAITNYMNAIESQNRLTDWLISDHVPIRVKTLLRIKKTEPTIRTTFDRKQVENPSTMERLKLIGTHDHTSVQEMISKFYDDVRSKLTEEKVIKKEESANTTMIRSSKVKKAIENKRSIEQGFRTGSRTIEDLKRARAHINTEVRSQFKKVQTKKWKSGIEFLRSNNTRSCWRWIKREANLAKNTIVSERIYKSGTRKVAKSEGENLEIWQNHFKSLSEKCKDEKRLIPTTSTNETLECITDSDITWNELSTVLKKLRKGKSAGNDGIPVEFYKIVQDENAPQSNLAKSMLTIFNRVFKEGNIPTEWQTCNIVPIYKKGDPRDPNNYRGIALINTALKILAKILANRINEACEQGNLIIKEQLGFIEKEECVAQAAALIETCQRRKIRNQETVLCFLDLKKAYDLVPHGRLIDKLTNTGMGPKILNFLRVMYENTFMRVRIGEITSNEFKYERGVRQGCPTSPIIFNLYINDILDQLKASKVEGVQEGVKGLLFADDTVLISDSYEQTQEKIDATRRWLIENSMELNANKCGILRIQRDEQVEKIDIGYENEIIPSVRCYTYLGIMINDRLDLNEMAQHRVQKGIAKAAAIAHTLANHKIPLEYKRMLVKNVLIPTLHYGNEIFGMAEYRQVKLKKVLDKSIALVLRHGSYGRLRVYQELDILPLYITSAVSRTRALIKWPSSKGVIADLLKHKFIARKHTWIKGALMWLKRMKIDTSEQWSSVKESIITKRLEALDERDRTKSNRFAKMMSIKSGKMIRKNELHFPEFQRGWHAITALRCSTLAFTNTLIDRGKAPAIYKDKCAFCKEDVKEDAAHMLLDCKAYDSVRPEKIKQLGVKNPRNVKKHMIMLLGGERLNSNVRKNEDWTLASAKFLSSITTIRAGAIRAFSM